MGRWPRRAGRSAPPAYWLLIFGLAFPAGGFSEIYTALQFALLSLALLATLAGAWRAQRWSAVGTWAAGWAGSAAALAAVALAPGSHSRQATLAVPPGLIPLILNAKQYALWFFRDAAGQAPLLLAVAGSAALVGGLLSGRGRFCRAAGALAWQSYRSSRSS